MARHYSGQNNYRLSKSLTIALITIVAILALIIWWVFSNRSDDTTELADDTTETTTGESGCLQGELSLPVGGDPTLVEEMVEEYNATDPVVRDYCVTAEVAGPGEAAATYVFAGTREEAAGALAQTGAVAASSQDSWSQADTVQAGVAATDGADTDLENVTFPVADAPTLSAAVALALAGDEDTAATALADDLDTTTDAATTTPVFAALESDELPGGYTFSPVDGAELPVWVIPVNAGTGLSEDQARAGAEFASFTTDTGDAGEATDTAAYATVVDRARALAEEPDAPAVEATTGAPSDTLIVQDTSGNMDRVVDGTQESYHTVVSRVLSDLARETGGLGNQVALNNYSSPINPGVTRGWRPNISFPDPSNGTNAANAIARFGTGGVPLTRAAAVAAADIASEHAATSGREVRVVLVTSGSASDYSDEAFLADIRAAGGDNVTFHVVHVGSNPVDQVLTDYAISTGGTAVTATTPQDIDATLRAAFGF